MKVSKQDIGFVLLQLMLFLAFAYDLESFKIVLPEALFWIGVFLFVSGALIIIVAVSQLNVNLSPFPSPLPGSKLIGKGAYKFIRHPIYTGIFSSFFGYAIISDSGYRILISLVLLLLFYFKTQYEEKQLRFVFPEYEEYKKQTGKFLPTQIFRGFGKR